MIGLINFASDAPALLVEGRQNVFTYRQLGERVLAARDFLGRLHKPTLAFCFAANGPAWVVAYLACLAEGVPLGLGDPASVARDRVIAGYRPNVVLLEYGSAKSIEGYLYSGELPGSGLGMWIREGATAYESPINPDLALLLSTSGSTGDAKFVRLSASNLLENARSIAEYLMLGPSEVATQSLPLHYSYGLSILNSHLLVGASILLTTHSFLRPEFWRTIDDAGCTSFAGVPYMYETLERLRIEPSARKKLKTLTQAGGHLRVESVRHFYQSAVRNQARFFVMYGQTEATARIAYVPPERLAEKIGSIGVAIPRGELWLEPVSGDDGSRQLLYRGPNVMLGYSTGPADLAKGDDMGGVLPTGDIAEMDADGFVRIVGRLARFAKLFGKRINLAAVEAEVESLRPVRAMALEKGDGLRIFLEGGGAGDSAAIRAHLAAWLGLPPATLRIENLDRLPLTASGKKNYKALI